MQSRRFLDEGWRNKGQAKQKEICNRSEVFFIKDEPVSCQINPCNKGYKCEKDVSREIRNTSLTKDEPLE